MEGFRIIEQYEGRNWTLRNFFSGRPLEYVKFSKFSDYHVGRHAHDFWEINVVTKGKGKHHIKDQSFEAVAGCLYIIPPGLEHAYDCDEDLTVHHILLHPDFFVKYKEITMMPGYVMLFEIEPFLRGMNAEPMFLRLGADEVARFKTEIATMSQYDALPSSSNAMNASKEIMFNITTLSLITRWCFIMDQKKTLADSSEEHYHLPGIVKAINFIHENYSEKITVERLLDLSRLSRAVFFREFRRICHVTPSAYIMGYRVQKAREMIENAGVTLSVAAYECGFCDASHLSKHLRR